MQQGHTRVKPSTALLTTRTAAHGSYNTEDTTVQTHISEQTPLKWLELGERPVSGQQRRAAKRKSRGEKQEPARSTGVARGPCARSEDGKKVGQRDFHVHHRLDLCGRQWTEGLGQYQEMFVESSFEQATIKNIATKLNPNINLIFFIFVIL